MTNPSIAAGTLSSRFGIGSLVVSTVLWMVFTTTLLLASRALIDLASVGGSCASGGPYQIATPCPPGVGLFLGVGIPVMIISVLAHAGLARRWGPQLIMLFWPALFCTFGLVFLVSATLPGSGVGGFILGGVFMAMGGLPLLAMVLRNPIALFALRNGRRGLAISAKVASVARLRGITLPGRGVDDAGPPTAASALAGIAYLAAIGAASWIIAGKAYLAVVA